MTDLASLRAHKNLAKKQYVQQTSGASGGTSSQDLWNRAEWERIKREHGSYPFGPQRDGGFISPPTLAGAPDWAFELMNMRRPPIAVHAGADFTQR
jgi:hypothetical protein